MALQRSGETPYRYARSVAALETLVGNNRYLVDVGLKFIEYVVGRPLFEGVRESILNPGLLIDMEMVYM